jgi:hypothetical protein
MDFAEVVDDADGTAEGVEEFVEEGVCRVGPEGAEGGFVQFEFDGKKLLEDEREIDLRLEWGDDVEFGHTENLVFLVGGTIVPLAS